MPNLESAKKAIRVSAKKRIVNDRRRKAMKESTKEVKKLVAAKDKKGAAESLKKAYQAIDKAAQRGVIKKNAAARKKSRITKALKNIG